MTTIILLVLLLALVQALLPAISKYRHNAVTVLAGPQDKITLGERGERAQRALRNLHETLPIFLGLALLTILHQVESGALLGAWIYLLARVVYVPLYVFGVRFIRSAAWNVGVLGLILMVPPLLGH
jgi:uncharacterized MAPEG superfamily protein